MPGGGPVQTATINVTIPIAQQPGTYALLAKADTKGELADSNAGNNAGGLLDMQVLSDKGTMVLAGTSGDDTIRLTRTTVNKHPHMTVNAGFRTIDYGLGAVTSIEVFGLDGDDTIIGSGALPPLLIDGYNGNDYLVGADGNDTLIGGANKDTIFGGAGNDRLNGNGGNDKLFGEAGADRLYGYDGNDTLDGGSSNDRLEGGAGNDVMLGQSGDDKFFAKDGAIDQLFGSSGNDSANIDATDVLSSIESSSTS
jgi:Ca2+-binding RTX toxin-like protein